MKPDSGKVSMGQTIKIGYYTQNTPQEKAGTKVIDVIRRSSDSIQLSDGTRLSASQYLNYFGIPPQKQFTDYALLSGGEKRLLNLLAILIDNPNFLILDEPTNDLDIYTQMKLENFLEDYEGCLFVVSHDRHFLDRVCNQLFVFRQNGEIKEYPFSYTDYLAQEKIERKEVESKTKSEAKPQARKPAGENKPRKLSYKEQKEKEEIENLLPELERRKAEIERQLNENNNLGLEQLNDLTVLYRELSEQIDEKELRWLELSEQA